MPAMSLPEFIQSAMAGALIEQRLMHHLQRIGVVHETRLWAGVFNIFPP